MILTVMDEDAVSDDFVAGGAADLENIKDSPNKQ